MGAVIIVPAWWVVVGFWLQCAIGAAVIARLQGRRLGPWFAGGVVFGILAVAAAVMAGPADEARPADRPGSDSSPALGVVFGLAAVVAVMALGAWLAR